MEAISIPNLAALPQTPRSAAGTFSPDKSTAPGSLPSFAQVVRDILVRTTTLNDTQSAHTSQSDGRVSLIYKRLNSTDTRGISSASAKVMDLPSLSLISLAIQSPVVPQAAPAEVQSQTKSGIASPGDSQPAAPSLPRAEVAPQSTDLLPASTAPASAFIPTQPPSLLSLPELMIQSTAGQLSTSNFPGTPASSSDKSVAFADQLQTNPNSYLEEHSVSAKSIADIQLLSALSPSLNGVSITALQPLISQLQFAAPANAPTATGPVVQAVHSTLAQAATKVSTASLPLFAALPAIFALPLSNGKNAPLAPAISPPVVLPLNSPSASHSGSQDSASNSGAQKSSDSSVSSSPATPREAPAFSQALANANDAKPEALPSTADQTSVIPSPSVPLNDHLAGSAANSLPEAPANPPQPAFHSLEAAASRFVSDAQLSQTSGHSEMRIAMQTDKLGTVELHARVTGDEIGAAITVEKRDAHTALAVELPALQQALSDKQLRVDQIALLQGPLHSTTGDAGAQSQAQQGDRGLHRGQTGQSFLRDDSGALGSSQSAVEAWGIFDSQGRLSVQA